MGLIVSLRPSSFRVQFDYLISFHKQKKKVSEKIMDYLISQITTLKIT
jgi:hypothetical protein